jgi:hypothetical protein
MEPLSRSRPLVLIGCAALRQVPGANIIPLLVTDFQGGLRHKKFKYFMQAADSHFVGEL